jgi:hypothetical protein
MIRWILRLFGRPSRPTGPALNAKLLAVHIAEASTHERTIR